jgi:glycosyltransferase involved in cell wall biosynthesis
VKKLAIITTHPIQYNAPLFELLTSRGFIKIKVFYTWGADVLKDKFDPGFGKKIQWDIPLLEGYDYSFQKNVAKEKGSHHFFGIQNPDLIKEIVVYKPDALLVFGWAFSSHLKAMKHFKNHVPVFFRGDSTLLDQQTGIKAILRKLFLKWVYSNVDTALFVGKSNRDYFLATGLDEHQLIFAPHAIDNNRFDTAHNDNESQAFAMRKKLGISSSSLVFLFSGKLEDKKDPLILLDAFKVVAQANDVHLVFAGSGPLENQLKEKASGYSQIHFLGFVNQQSITAVYNMSNVLVLPSKGPGETWGLAVNEAMASGLAVIVSNKCGCAEDLVIEKDTGFIFTSGDIIDLTKKMQWMIDNRNRVEEMGRKAKEKVRNFSLEILAASIENAILLR